MKLIKEDCNEALYGREEIDDYLKKMKEIGIKNLGDLRKFKQNVKSDIGKDTDSDIEQIRMYRDALGKDFKIQDEEEPKRKVVGEKLDLDEALGLKGVFSDKHKSIEELKRELFKVRQKMETEPFALNPENDPRAMKLLRRKRELERLISQKESHQ